MKTKHPAERLEIEVKYILPRTIFSRIQNAADATKQELEQIYLSRVVVESFTRELGIPTDVVFDEWRIRRVDREFRFTAKGARSGDGTQRREFEIGLATPLFERLKCAAEQEGTLLRICKTRYSYPVSFADDVVLVQIDDYHAIDDSEGEMDFVTCEVETHSKELALILLKGRFFAPDLLFLKQGRNVTGIQELSNNHLAQHGFVAHTYAGILDWLNQRCLCDLDRAQEEFRKGNMASGLLISDSALGAIRVGMETASDDADLDDTSLTQDVLVDMAFTVADSLGRKENSDRQLAVFDRLGKGWLRDYHEIISSDCYIRLHAKPQIFRPGLGYSNTTTRGAHTSDVIACSMQLARQLGLNVELCIAAAALHDIGHPAGGHVGEEVLYERTGCRRHFQHHVFSLCLAELFGLNLLREVMECALHHKSGGKSLMSPSGKPQEYGIVRLADKISYSPWDMFDSISNGYLTHEQVIQISQQDKDLGGRSIFDILGNQPMEWIWTLTRAAVKESAEAHRVRFSEASGETYAAFKEARRIVYELVHPQIYWGSMKAQLNMAYEKIEMSFPDIEDIVPIVAYITDQELVDLTRLIENEPKTKPLDLKYLEASGFGFCKLIRRLYDVGSQSPMIYYQSLPEIG